MHLVSRIFGVVFLGWMLSATAHAAVPNQPAFDLVQSTTDQLLQRIVEKRDQYLQDDQLFFSEIMDLLEPVIDFKRISRRVMAKYYKKATIDQREKFEQVFRQSLLKIYAKGLLEFDDQEVVVLEPSSARSGSAKKQKVDIEVLDQRGGKYPISYSMYLNKANEWKMENVIVNGINIGLTYRNQFARLMKLNKNDIDLVITDWNAQVNAE